MQRFALAAALTAAALAPTAFAAEYHQVQADKSTIAFTYQQMGVAMEGRFKTFASQLSFDPAQPEKARATIDVELASVDTGSAENDDEVAGKDWFNSKVFPTAHFEAASVKALGGNRYEVSGKLTIKGASRDVLVPATFSEQGDSGVLDGSFTLRRADYAIGEGEWAAFDVVANDIQVKFHLTALAAK